MDKFYTFFRSCTLQLQTLSLTDVVSRITLHFSLLLNHSLTSLNTNSFWLMIKLMIKQWLTDDMRDLGAYFVGSDKQTHQYIIHDCYINTLGNLAVIPIFCSKIGPEGGISTFQMVSDGALVLPPQHRKWESMWARETPVFEIWLLFTDFCLYS